ncbi:hypothetical protein LSTR_LSTR014359 [Laodelphax striatellus]|uniref:Serpin domain-containing protein n=1 Tax=Laodelphax striatellus TaxID=195883 RepID=A0A482WN19_LAOST|nr:hypothetical protein LSTR_LSTR014359 [Laodelphax striatellus]
MMYNKLSLWFFLTIFVILLLNLSFSECSVRKKRYVSFPEGSTFTFAFCMTLKAMTYGDIDIFSEAVAVAVNYDLPSNVSQLPFAMLPNAATMLPNGATMLPNASAANIPPSFQAQ